MVKSPSKIEAMAVFKEKAQTALGRIRDYHQFEKDEEVAKIVLETGRTLFGKHLDTMDTPSLIRLGGKLSGVYGYIAQRATYARAERDVYEQKADEVDKEIFLSLIDQKYKVSQVRALISKETVELKDLVMQKDVEKNQWENILQACDKMTSFIQSAIRVKENERSKTNMAGRR